MLVKFNPADIVSVPSDCECQKIRVSKYSVLEVARGIIEDAVYECGDDPDDEEFYDAMDEFRSEGCCFDEDEYEDEDEVEDDEFGFLR